jgi:isopenicillin-N N-acyltransferase-like protein
MTTYPTIRVSGGPRERGRQYGEQARERVRRSIDAYAQVFAHEAGWTWERVREEAAAFRAPIAAHGAKYLEEIEGIAEGAGVEAVDVLAINVRTEVMFAAKARRAACGSLPHECSSLAISPERTADRKLLVAQTWDWLVHAFDTVVVVEAQQDDGPDYVTVVEAGLLAKTGMNSAGIALATNALVTSDDLGRPGLPYHVALRSILDAETVSDGLAALLRGERSSSANYLIADRDGVAVDVEAAPGDQTRVFLGYPEDGVLLHVNHFTWTDGALRDLSLWAIPDSPFRLARLRQLTGPAAGRLAVEDVQRVLSDEQMSPYAICCRPDPRDEGVMRWATILAVVMEPATRTLWLASGIPADTGFERRDYGTFLAKPSPVRGPAGRSAGASALSTE